MSLQFYAVLMCLLGAGACGIAVYRQYRLSRLIAERATVLGDPEDQAHKQMMVEAEDAHWKEIAAWNAEFTKATGKSFTHPLAEPREPIEYYPVLQNISLAHDMYGSSQQQNALAAQQAVFVDQLWNAQLQNIQPGSIGGLLNQLLGNQKH